MRDKCTWIVCNEKTEVQSLVVSCASAKRTAVGAGVKAEVNAASVGGSATGASKRECCSRLFKRDERKAMGKKYKVWVMPNPPLPRGRDERRTWRDK